MIKWYGSASLQSLGLHRMICVLESLIHIIPCSDGAILGRPVGRHATRYGLDVYVVIRAEKQANGMPFLTTLVHRPMYCRLEHIICPQGKLIANVDNQSVCDRRCINPAFLRVHDLKNLDIGLLPQNGETLEVGMCADAGCFVIDVWMTILQWIMECSHDRSRILRHIVKVRLWKLESQRKKWEQCLAYAHCCMVVLEASVAESRAVVRGPEISARHRSIVCPLLVNSLASSSSHPISNPSWKSPLSLFAGSMFESRGGLYPLKLATVL